MADRGAITRILGDFAYAAQTDVLLVGGLKTNTAATHLNLSATGVTSNVNLDATAAISLDAATSSNFTITANSAAAQTLTLQCTNAGVGTGDITSSCKSTFGVSCNAFTVSAQAYAYLDALTSSHFTITANNAAAQTLTLQCTNAGVGAGNIDLTCKSNLTVSAGVSFNATAQSSINLDSATAGISLDSVLSSNFTITANNAAAQTLTLQCTNAGVGAGNITVSCKSVVSVSAGTAFNVTAQSSVTLDSATAGISLDAATASNLSVSGAAADLTFGARGNVSAITLNQAGDVTLSGFTATSIIGALNELKLTGGSAVYVSTTIPPGASTVNLFAAAGTGVAEWLFFIDFSGNIRAGFLVSTWDPGAIDVRLFETGTTDIGSTTDITFSASYDGANLSLTANNAGANTYTFKAVRRTVF